MVKKRYFCVQITLDNKSDKITKIGECLSQNPAYLQVLAYSS